MSRLFRRRLVWVPTVWGTLLLLAATAAAATAAVWSSYGWLAADAPARGPGGVGARILVVEGWMNAREMAGAVDLLRRGRYDRLLTSGGPIEPWNDAGGFGSYAQRAAADLRAAGIEAARITAVPAPASAQERTFLSALMVREWLQQTGGLPAALDVYSSGVHARRTWLAYRMAFRDATAIGVLAGPPTDFDPPRWWTSSNAAKTVLAETLGLAWMKCCFWPGAPGSHDER